MALAAAPQPDATAAVTVATLAAELRTLEEQIRRAWADLLWTDAALAGRVSRASRLVHSARTVLEDSTIS